MLSSVSLSTNELACIFDNFRSGFLIEAVNKQMVKTTELQTIRVQDVETTRRYQYDVDVAKARPLFIRASSFCHSGCFEVEVYVS